MKETNKIQRLHCLNERTRRINATVMNVTFSALQWMPTYPCLLHNHISIALRGMEGEVRVREGEASGLSFPLLLPFSSYGQSPLHNLCISYSPFLLIFFYASSTLCLSLCLLFFLPFKLSFPGSQMPRAGPLVWWLPAGGRTQDAGVLGAHRMPHNRML